MELVVDLLAHGLSLQQLLEEYPGLRDEDVRACLAYASEVLKAESVHLFQIRANEAARGRELPPAARPRIARAGSRGRLDPEVGAVRARRGVLRLARSESGILATFDKGFGALAFRQRVPATCEILLLRLSAPDPQALAEIAIRAIEARSDWSGTFAVIEPDRIRIRPLPSSRP